MDVWRCDITGNPVGTDTRMIGCPCTCQGCRAGAEIERLRAALKPFADCCYVDNDGDITYSFGDAAPRDYLHAYRILRGIHEQREPRQASSKPGSCVDGEPNTCTQPFNWDDGVPYCDTCGLYRQSVHHKQREDTK